MRGRSVRTSTRSGGGSAATRLTRCAGTWLEHDPDAAEQTRIAAATRALQDQRAVATAFHHDPEAAQRFCIELFREPAFAPLAFADELVERMLVQQGEPPVVDEEHEDEFADYLRDAIYAVALPNPRRALAAQLRRFLPIYAESGQWQAAVAIDHSALRTSLGSEITPFLAQMALAGLAAYYETHDEL